MSTVQLLPCCTALLAKPRPAGFPGARPADGTFGVASSGGSVFATQEVLGQHREAADAHSRRAKARFEELVEEVAL